MLIALLALLGVDLIVLVAFVAFVLTRKRWVKRQPGAFHGAIRVSDGEVDGLRAKWSRGYGRWVRDVLVWTKGPFLFRSELVAADGLDGRRRADPHEIKRLDEPIVVRVKAGTATVDVAAESDDAELILGPYRPPAGERPTR
ncbi:MAG TPA: hypothetical protein VFG47_05610 [Geminicoccaceae bacterium]|nr:hypothetical protein [Geminicoccaceae bacterium]